MCLRRCDKDPIRDIFTLGYHRQGYPFPRPIPLRFVPQIEIGGGWWGRGRGEERERGLQGRLSNCPSVLQEVLWGAEASKGLGKVHCLEDEHLPSERQRETPGGGGGASRVARGGGRGTPFVRNEVLIAN